ncbi:MAG: helix-turn-helix domain-containing protein [Candidatus Schekmanbacteria bacterium]|nr:helix-turn-helix domain-containing protein [Candidatus Schekmanbacteria bacterium]
MPTRAIEQDTCTPAERAADEKALEAFERGGFLAVPPEAKEEATERLRRRRREAEEAAAKVGLILREIRGLAGVTQAELAKALGTQKSNVSRMESGRYKGLGVVTLVAVRNALRSLTGIDPFVLLGERFSTPLPAVSHEELRKISTPEKYLESVAR